MNSHELARKLLEMPDLPVEIDTIVYACDAEAGDHLGGEVKDIVIDDWAGKFIEIRDYING